MKLDFPVTVCLGRGDGGDVSVRMNVTKEEFDLLVEACENGDEISEYDSLSDLYERIISAASDECDWDYGGDESDLDEATYLVSYPEKVMDAAL